MLFFEIIDEIECDWGFHTVIECPNCKELFSVDKKCPAFSNIFELLKIILNYILKKKNLIIYQILIRVKLFV